MYKSEKAVVGIVLTVSIFFGSSSGYTDEYKPFDCESHQCGLKAKESYGQLVIGSATAIANKRQSAQVFKWAKNNQYWQSIPDSLDKFQKLITVVSVKVPNRSPLKTQTGSQDSQHITVLMTNEEQDAVRIKVGDFVRFRPHGPDHATPTKGSQVPQNYWDLLGCVAVLCRSSDEPCPDKYLPGIFNVNDGSPLATSNEAPLPNLRSIDPQTYLPK